MVGLALRPGACWIFCNVAPPGGLIAFPAMKSVGPEISFAWLGSTVAELPARMLDEGGIVAALLLSVVGIALRFYTPHRQMMTEELIKDGKLTPDEARRQMRFLERASLVVSILGLAILVWVLIDLAG